MKISLAMIVKDDEHTLEECLQSVRPHVDEICIADTGSTDRSLEIARKYADRVELFLGANDEHGRITDFAMARNFSFSLVTGTHVMWLDGDDYLRGGEHIRRLAEEMPPNAHVLWPYEYGRNAEGQVTCLQIRERLMRPPHAQVWRSPVHEYCSSNEPGNVSIISDQVVVEHHSDVASRAGKVREPGRNLRILESYVDRVHEQDVRALYYIGVEYAAQGNTPQSLRYLRRYIEIADWHDEKCRAMLNLAEYYLRNGDYAPAIRWAQDAMITKSWPEPWFVLGRAFFAMARELKQETRYNYKRAVYYFMKGLEHPTDVLLFANPQERYEIHAMLNVCLHTLGDNEQALWSCEEGLKGFTAEKQAEVQADLKRYLDQRHPCALLLNNRAEFVKDKRLKTVAATVAELEQDGQLHPAQAAIIRETLRGKIRIETEEDRAPVAREVAEQSAEAGKLDLVFFLGPALERWTPETWERGGMGGSETMAWHMARRLRKLGHRVRFYGDCSAQQEGVYEGVEWLQWQRFRDVECDVLIASRYPWPVDDNVSVNGVTIGGCKATARVLWTHDVHCGPDLDMRRSLRFDRILCLSDWHKQFFLGAYPGLSASKVHVTRNGIDLGRFEGTEERNPHRAVYSSSPDRGLQAVVTLWPRIREQVPDAELHVFYGWTNWEKSCQGDPAQQAAIAHLKQLCRTTKGMVMRDRVNQKELAREFMRAGVWAYPTWFSETSCITAMEAQAAGLYVVSSALAALNETVADRGILIPWDSDTREPTADYADRFIAETVSAMLEAEQTEAVRSIEYARDHFGLDELAADWDRMLTGLVEELKNNPVPSFDGKAAE